MRFLLGGYSGDQGGSAHGIGMLVAGAPDDHLAGGPLGYGGQIVRADSPSWLATHPSLGVVYAALEGRGEVQAWRQTGDTTWVALGEPVAVGDAVCHVVVTPDRLALVASCWGDGRVVRLALDAEGRPHSPVALPSATDPYGQGAAASAAPDIDLRAATRALRESVAAEFAHLIPDHDREPEPAPVVAPDTRPSRSHQTVALSNGVLATTDMGLDVVRFWQASTTELRATPHQVVLPRGSGPRHMVWHPSGHLYVVTESSREVYALRWDQSASPSPSASATRTGPAQYAGAGAWRVVGAASLGPTLDTDAAAELAMSRDGEFLYAGVRGSDTISTLRIRGEGESLEPFALVDAGVDRPRHHVVVRDTLLVAGQVSDEVASLTLDERTGVPGRVRHRTAAPTPTCILPLG